MPTTIVDVLRAELGDLDLPRLESLGATDLDVLAEAINAFYSRWLLPPVADDGLRVYSGGWIAGNATVPLANKYLLTSLLYAPSVVMHEPLADWFDPDRARVRGLPPIKGRRLSVMSSEPDIRRGDGFFKLRSDPERTRTLLAAVIPTLIALEPLLQNGTVVAVPQWQLVAQRQEPLLTAVRNDVRDGRFAELLTTIGPLPRTDQIRGLAVTPPGAIKRSEELRAAVQDPSYFFHKTAAISDATGSLYVPPAAPDAALLDFKLASAATALQRKDIDMQVISALGQTTLPFLQNADARTIVSIHRDEKAFADWRAVLRTIARAIRTLPSDGVEFSEDAASALSDALLPRAHEIQRAVSRSAAMKDALGPSSLAFGIGAATLVGADLLTGAPVGVTDLTNLGLGTAASWLLSGVFRGVTGRPRGVFARLVADWDANG